MSSNIALTDVMGTETSSIHTEIGGTDVHPNPFIVGPDDLILITGANGFIGSKLVENLLERGFRNLRCFARPSSKVVSTSTFAGPARVEFFRGNLLSVEDCVAAVKGVKVIYHLAAGRGEKSYPDAFMNSVVTTRNLLEACRQNSGLRRFVNISSFAIYTNRHKPKWRMLDESCPIEAHPELRGEAYCFAKIKQDEVVAEYGEKFKVPCVTMRPGYVYGPGKSAITGRIGIDTFGIFLHLGGSNRIPLTYVDNCADAIALAGLKPGIDGEIFNVVDDELPTSRKFLRLYKRNVRNFKSLYVPHFVSYLLSCMWEKYSLSSQGQLPPVFNSRRWFTYWKKTRYSNEKLKSRLGWKPKVSLEDGLRNYFEACRSEKPHA